MILLSALGFGSYGIWSRIIGQDFGVFFQGWVRSAIVLAILIPIALYTKSFKSVTRADRKWIITTVLLGMATQAPLYFAYNHMDIGTTILVFYAMYVITSYAVGRLFLNERINLAKLISLLLAFGGLLILFGFSFAQFSILAFALAAVNGIASGGEVSTTKKSSQKFSSLQIGIYVWLGVLVTHLPLSIMFGERQILPALTMVWFAMLGFALAGLASFWLVIEGYKYVDASIGGLIGLLEIIFGVVFGILIFHEHVTVSILLGGGLIIIAAMLPDLVALASRKKTNTN
jgi:drug/metabolite transporter (DMT)-like permease